MPQRYESDLIGLMPCPVKVPMEKKVSAYAQEIAAKGGPKLKYEVYSNAVMQEDILEDIDYLDDEDDLPGIMIAPGFSRFFHTHFKKTFRDRGTFASVMDGVPSKAFIDAGITDEKGQYDIIAFNPLVIVVDKTRDANMPTPHSWMDITSEAYADKIGLRGHNDADICESILFTLYKAGGEEALRALGRNCSARMHPSEMVKTAGTHRPDAPSVYIIPYSFAHLIKPRETIEVVWPDDGAIVNPIVMLTRKNVSPAVRDLARFFVEPQGAQIFESVGFRSICSGLDSSLPENATFNWVGWDFLSERDICAFQDECNEIAAEDFHKRKGLPPRQEMLKRRAQHLAQKAKSEELS